MINGGTIFRAFFVLLVLCVPVSLVASELDDQAVEVSPSPPLSPAIEIEPDVVINEILPNPSGPEPEEEFIELKNISEDEVDVSGWQLDDKQDGGSGIFLVPEKTELKGGEILLLPRPETGIALNNDGDSVFLLDTEGVVRDSYDYTESSTDVSLARDSEGNILETITPTPGEENIFSDSEDQVPEEPEEDPSTSSGQDSQDEDEEENAEEEQQEYSGDLVINEYIPNPEGADADGEFIEIRNSGGDNVDLDGWKLDDVADAGSKVHVIGEVTIEAGTILSFPRSETGIALNNNGDSVRLLNPLDEVVDEHVYSSSKEAIAFARNASGDFKETTAVTEGRENEITEPKDDAEEEDDEEDSASEAEAEEEAKKIALSTVRGEKVGTIVNTQGVVSVPPGVFGETTIYLSGSGIQVYLSREEWPKLSLGDKVSLTATLSSVQGEARLKLGRAGDINVMKNEAAPVPKKVLTGEIGEKNEGYLVSVAGRVVKTSGNTFYIDDGSGEIKIYIKPATGIDKPKMKKGMVVSIIGIVSQTSSGYRVLPRFQEDVLVGAVAGLTSFPRAGKIVDKLQKAKGALLVPVAFSAWILFTGARKREPLFFG